MQNQTALSCLEKRIHGYTDVDLTNSFKSLQQFEGARAGGYPEAAGSLLPCSIPNRL